MTNYWGEKWIPSIHFQYPVGYKVSTTTPIKMNKTNKPEEFR
jgi:hypothetical protein